MGNGSFHHVSPDPNQDGESVGITQDSVGNQPNLWENIERKKEHNQTVNQRPRWRNTLQRIEEECVSPDANEDGESVATTQDSVDNQSLRDTDFFAISTCSQTGHKLYLLTQVELGQSRCRNKSRMTRVK